MRFLQGGKIDKLTQMTIHLLRSCKNNLEINLPFSRKMATRSAYIVEEYGIQSWFKSLPATRDYLVSVVKFLRKNTKANLRHELIILESGCGIGQTFVVLHKYGFRNFIGVERDRKTYEAAKKFLSLYGIEGRIINGDGREILNWISEGSIDACLALGWTFYIPDLGKVFYTGSKALRQNGLMMIDMIRSDLALANEEDERTYQRYPYKHSIESVKDLAVKNGFDIVMVEDQYKWRAVLYLRKI